MLQPVTPFRRTVLVALGAAACSGVIGEPGAQSRDPEPAGWEPGERGPLVGNDGEPLTEDDAEVILADPLAWGPTPIRRLSRREYADTLAALTGVELSEADMASVPSDSLTPFDNDAETQIASDALIEGLSRVAELVTDRVLENSALRAQVVPCAPSSWGERECVEQFVREFGRRVMRRPLSTEEVEDYVSVAMAMSEEHEDTDAGVRVVLRAFLQDPSMVYLVELGEGVDASGATALSDFEVASRLSFLIWGRGPDDALLDRAARSELSTEEEIRSTAEAMLADDRAKSRITRFVAMWLGYVLPLPNPDLDEDMRLESATLIDRVLFQRRGSVLDLFTSDETYVTADLAESYGLPQPANPEGDWVRYQMPERRGILSHGSFLSNGVKGGQTSPTRRGIHVLRRLTCTEIPLPPPELEVDVDEPPETDDPNACKIERYTMHSSDARCANCHRHVDPIGFGLERFDARGRYRTHEPERPECGLEGRGDISGVGEFSGPGQLAQLLIDSGRLDECFATQVFRFAMGRQERATEASLIASLAYRFRDSEHRLDALLLELVSSPGFRHRVVEGESERQDGP